MIKSNTDSEFKEKVCKHMTCKYRNQNTLCLIKKKPIEKTTDHLNLDNMKKKLSISSKSDNEDNADYLDLLSSQVEFPKDDTTKASDQVKEDKIKQVKGKIEERLVKIESKDKQFDFLYYDDIMDKWLDRKDKEEKDTFFFHIIRKLQKRNCKLLLDLANGIIKLKEEDRLRKKEDDNTMSSGLFNFDRPEQNKKKNKLYRFEYEGNEDRYDPEKKERGKEFINKKIEMIQRKDNSFEEIYEVKEMSEEEEDEEENEAVDNYFDYSKTSDVLNMSYLDELKNYKEESIKQIPKTGIIKEDGLNTDELCFNKNDNINTVIENEKKNDTKSETNELSKAEEERARFVTDAKRIRMKQIFRPYSHTTYELAAPIRTRVSENIRKIQRSLFQRNIQGYQVEEVEELINHQPVKDNNTLSIEKIKQDKKDKEIKTNKTSEPSNEDFINSLIEINSATRFNKLSVTASISNRDGRNDSLKSNRSYITHKKVIDKSMKVIEKEIYDSEDEDDFELDKIAGVYIEEQYKENQRNMFFKAKEGVSNNYTSEQSHVNYSITPLTNTITTNCELKSSEKKVDDSQSSIKELNIKRKKKRLSFKGAKIGKIDLIKSTYEEEPKKALKDNKKRESNPYQKIDLKNKQIKDILNEKTEEETLNENNMKENNFQQQVLLNKQSINTRSKSFSIGQKDIQNNTIKNEKRKGMIENIKIGFFNNHKNLFDDAIVIKNKLEYKEKVTMNFPDEIGLKRQSLRINMLNTIDKDIGTIEDTQEVKEHSIEESMSASDLQENQFSKKSIKSNELSISDKKESNLMSLSDFPVNDTNFNKQEDPVYDSFGLINEAEKEWKKKQSKEDVEYKINIIYDVTTPIQTSKPSEQELFANKRMSMTSDLSTPDLESKEATGANVFTFSNNDIETKNFKKARAMEEKSMSFQNIAENEAKSKPTIPELSESEIINQIVDYKLKLAIKMNRILDNRRYGNLNDSYTLLEYEVNNMVSPEFIKFVYQMDKDKQDKILKIQHFWRRRINMMIIKKIGRATRQFQQESIARGSRFTNSNGIAFKNIRESELLRNWKI